MRSENLHWALDNNFIFNNKKFYKEKLVYIDFYFVENGNTHDAILETDYGKFRMSGFKPIYSQETFDKYFECNIKLIADDYQIKYTKELLEKKILQELPSNMLGHILRNKVLTKMCNNFNYRDDYSLELIFKKFNTKELLKDYIDKFPVLQLPDYSFKCVNEYIEKNNEQNYICKQLLTLSDEAFNYYLKYKPIMIDFGLDLYTKEIKSKEYNNIDELQNKIFSFHVVDLENYILNDTKWSKYFADIIKKVYAILG